MTRGAPTVLWVDEGGAWATGELARDWTLTEADHDLMLRVRGDLNRLRFALELCALRVSGAFVSNRLFQGDWLALLAAIVAIGVDGLVLGLGAAVTAPTSRVATARDQANRLVLGGRTT